MSAQNVTRRLVMAALFIACALVVNAAEGMLPMPLPGLKLGAANVFTLAALVMLGVKAAFCVTVLRVLLAWLFTGNWFAFLCSMAGGVAAAIVMSLLYCKMRRDFSLPWISVAGAWAFNAAQTLLVSYMIGDARAVFYMIPLFIAGTAAGWAVGRLAQEICRRLGASYNMDR
ncbi:MAG: Gx transporter family protein [Cloacibacillus sp.]